ncbi:MAG: hypothetical protein ACYTF6_06875 [Planctomycetota bacterium]|jgi:hypothetical protein
MNRPWAIQLVLIVAAAALLIGAGLLQRPLDEMAREHELVFQDHVVLQSHPQLALLTKVFGGLRAPVVAYLWIRAEQQKQAGRHFDAMQLADLICQLMPRFPGVWDYHAWNMAWNISVQTHTPEERWHWVMNGVRLLRDRGIPLNPKALVLYKQLAWIFYEKMGGRMDEMHWEYKQRWAMEMQALLGAPPLGEPREVVEAFRPLANESLLDKDPRRKGQHEIQPDRFAALMADQQVRDYLVELQRRFLSAGQKPQELIDFARQRLLDIYNRYSFDESVAVARLRPVELETERDKNLSEWINSQKHADARGKLLNFVRAQKLWNVYKMDPQWMLELMKPDQKEPIPLDWRLVWTHGLYWNSYGLKVCKDIIAYDEVDSLNTARTLCFSLRDLAFFGKLVFRPEQDAPGVERMKVRFMSDRRFIDHAHRQYLELIEKVRAARNESLQENTFRDGHVNFLIDAIKMLHAAGQDGKAERYRQWVKQNYGRKGEDWDMETLEEFVDHHLFDKFSSPNPDVAISQITVSVCAAFKALALGSTKHYHKSLDRAAFVYRKFDEAAPKRLRLEEFEFYVAGVLRLILARPESMGEKLDLEERIALYDRLSADERGSRWLPMIYDSIKAEKKLRALCERKGLTFEQAFPPPPGLRGYRRSLIEFSGQGE